MRYGKLLKLWLKKAFCQILQLFYWSISVKAKKTFIVIISSPQSETFGNLSRLVEEFDRQGVEYKIIRDGLTVQNIYYTARAKIICIDQATRLTSTLRIEKSSTHVIQLWHAGGAFKKVGFDACNGTKSDFERIKRIHGNVTFFIVSDKKLITLYARAFNIPISHVLPYGVVRTDRYFERRCSANSHITKYVLWAPTFRSNGRERKSFISYDDICYLNKCLFKIGYKLTIRLHPSIKNDFRDQNIEDWSDKPLPWVLENSSILITDYSSIIFDYSLFDGRVFWYVPDIDDYKIKQRGLYFDPIVKFPEYTAKNIQELFIKITGETRCNCEEIRSEFMSSCDGLASFRILKLIKDLVGE